MPNRLLLFVALVLLFSCADDPSPEGMVQPEILDVSATVLEDGRVSFSCTMNDTGAVTECGFVLSAGDLQETTLYGKIVDDRQFSALGEGLTAGCRYSYSAFAGNGRALIRKRGGDFAIIPVHGPSGPDNPQNPETPDTPPTLPDGPGSMLLTVDSGSNGWVSLPFQGNVNVSVDWGDGSLEAFKGAYADGEWISHKYASAGKYDVCIEGTAEWVTTFGFSYPMSYPEKILAVLRWGNLEASSYDMALKNCINLSEIAADTLGAFRHAGVDAFFMGCKSLKEVPDSLFAWYGGESLSGLFLDCEALESIPAHIFAKCSSVHNFISIFECCSSLTAVPEGLFDDCPEAVELQAAFKGCTGLTSVPVSLFDNNRKVRIFRETFMGCDMVSGESPYTLIGSEKVHLYERENFRDEFKVPVEYDDCFQPFGYIFVSPKWADYGNIPQSWK